MENTHKKNVRALGLCSGGLDSILAALVLKDQGIEVAWVSFVTPFFSSEKAEKAAKLHNIPLIVKDISEQYLEMLKNPPGGYGQNMNPCLDCHTMMFAEAGKIKTEEGFDFLFSGEVSGQRPMSQTKQSLRYVEKRSGFDGYIVRPLSARVLPVTRPEEEGLVDRERLLGINGRSRKPQMELAKEKNVTDYPSPAGGCLLTDVRFSMKLRDLFSFSPFARISEYHLLKAGRHLRLDDNSKLVVGRDKNDNSVIMEYYDPEHDYLFKLKDKPGPVTVMTCSAKKPEAEIIKMAATICASYGKTSQGDSAEVVITEPGTGQCLELTVSAVSISGFAELMVG